MNRSGQRHPNESLSEQVDSTGVLPTPETSVDYHDTRPGRAGSEPTEQLLSSIPLHLRSNERSHQFPPLFKRNASDADSRLPLQRRSVIPQELDDSSEMVDTRGLSVWHSSNKPELDLVFIHGLGGSSLKTWSFARQTRNFWPLWLSREPELAAARILTFGYNADFRGPSTILNITDFAKDLLFRMLTFEEEAEDGSKIRIGEVRDPKYHA